MKKKRVESGIQSAWRDESAALGRILDSITCGGVENCRGAGDEEDDVKQTTTLLGAL